MLEGTAQQHKYPELRYDDQSICLRIMPLGVLECSYDEIFITKRPI